MAKLPRITAKVFASNAAETDIGQFGSALSGTKVTTSDVSQIQALPAYEQGWKAAVISNRNYPTLQEMNGLQKTFSQQIAYTLQEGVPEYDAGTSYYIGSWCKGVDADGNRNIYESLTDDNIGNALTDDTKWKKVTIGGGGSGGGGTAGLNMFDTVIKDHILSYEESKGLALQGTYVYKTAVAGSRYGYANFYNECVSQKNAGTETTLTVGSTAVTVYKNPNGHIFYDIAQKSQVDRIFENTGTAWYYGIDTQNERIFLPRNNNFVQMSVNSANVNDFAAAGLPNITGTVGTGASGNGLTSGAFAADNSQSSRHDGGSDANYTAPKASFNASRSSAVYGKSNTVQPAALKQLLYIVVGNTEVASSVTDVVDITTTENDTIPLGYSTYQANAQPSVAWLASNGQQNSGQVYTTFYNEYVLKIGQKFAAGYVRNHTDEYTDYDLVINQDDITFRLPLFDGSEAIMSQNYENLPILSNESIYTCNTNGWLFAQGKSTESSNNFLVLELLDKNNNTIKGVTSLFNAAIGYTHRININVAKGDRVKIRYEGISLGVPIFIHAKGNGTLYFKISNAVQNLELLDAGAITEVLTTKTDAAQAAHAAMPSDRYVNLTLGASGTTYTAPADGWFFILKRGNAAGQYLGMKAQVGTLGQYFGYQGQIAAAGGYLAATVPVRKSQNVGIDYNLVSEAGSFAAFGFVYAGGAQ